MSRGTRLPSDFAPSPALMQYARDQGVIDVNRMLSDFTDYYLSVSGPKGTKLDWAATWRMWARKAGDQDREKAAREQRYLQRFAPASGLVMARDRNPRRFMQAVEEKTPEAPLTPEQREYAAAALKRMGIQRTAH
jgi:hypothetical protein